MRAEQFAAHARLEERHWWFTARREILVRLLRAVTPAGGAVADIGCGTGGNTAAFAAAGFDAIGLDPAAEALALARARFPSVRFLDTGEPAAAAEHLAPGGTVVMGDVLEHVADDRALLAAAVAAAPPGGHLLLTVPADQRLWSDHDVAFGHHRRYGEAAFRALWDGLPVEERLCSHFNARLRPLIATYRGRRRRPSSSGGGDLEVSLGVLDGVLHRLFRSEAGRLVAAIDGNRPAFRRGVSLVAILRRR